jgi:hypothetical protein
MANARGKKMSFDNGFHAITVAEAHALPEAEFRALFVRVVIELIGEFGEIFIKRVDFLKDGRRVETLTIKEMQSIVLRHQAWFAPKTARLAANNA